MHVGDKALLDAADLVANETMRLMRESAADPELDLACVLLVNRPISFPLAGPGGPGLKGP
jgi:hypothetical protein